MKLVAKDRDANCFPRAGFVPIMSIDAPPLTSSPTGPNGDGHSLALRMTARECGFFLALFANGWSLDDQPVAQ